MIAPRRISLLRRATLVAITGLLAAACSDASNGSSASAGGGGASSGGGSASTGGGAGASGGAGGVASPGYTPFALSSCDDGALGAPATGPDALEDAISVVYSDAERLDGKGKSCKSSIAAGHTSFGGKFRTPNIDVGDGDDLWIREALFFPEGFCFGYGTTYGDGWGSTKWNRIEFDNSPNPAVEAPGDRLTLELGNFADQSCNAAATVWGAAREYSGNANCQPANQAMITTGAWHMLQWQVHFAADASGLIRFWLDDAFLGEFDGATLPSDKPKVSFVQYGDYWNGSPYQDVEWYIDDIIMTKEAPDTKDAQGHPYIAASARVSDWQ